MRTMRTGRRRWGGVGYTALELVIGASITAILAGISMPNLLGTIQRYQADAAPRQVMGDLRYAQSQAIARGMEGRVLIFDSAGQATIPGGANVTDTTKANSYRVEVRPTGGAWPALTGTRANNDNVLSEWLNLATDYRQTVTQANAVVFTSRGSLQNSATSLNIGLQGGSPSGVATRTVRTHPSGQVEIL